MATGSSLFATPTPKSPRSQEIERLNNEIDTLKEDAENYRQLIDVYLLQIQDLRSRHEERPLFNRQVEVLGSRLKKAEEDIAKGQKDKTQLMVCAAIALPVFSFFFYQIGKKSQYDR